MTKKTKHVPVPGESSDATMDDDERDVKKLGSQIYTIPNALTAIRIAATPLIGCWVAWK